MFHYLVGFMFLLWAWPDFTTKFLIPVVLLVFVIKYGRLLYRFILSEGGKEHQRVTQATASEPAAQRPAVKHTHAPDQNSPSEVKSVVDEDEEFMALQRAMND